MLAAALAFYVLLSAAPLGLFLVAVAGSVFGEERARAELLANLTEVLGPAVVEDVAGVLDRAGHGSSTVFATALGIVFFFVAMNSVFGTVRAGLNHVWGVRPTVAPSLRGAGAHLVRRRLLALVLVAVSGLVFLAVLVLRAVLDYLAAHVMDLPWALRAVEFAVGWAALTGITTAVYRMLPDARIALRDAFLGASVTGALSMVGALLGGHYAAHLAVSSPYGAAGSVIAFLTWVYYCAQTFFFGAEFTAAWSRHRGEGVHPLAHARRITVEELLDDPTEDHSHR